MSNYPLILLCLISIVSMRCTSDDSLHQLSIEEVKWTWVYSINDTEQSDTLAKPESYGHNFTVVHAARDAEESPISVRIFMDDQLVSIHHVRKREHIETINEGYPNEIAVYNMVFDRYVMQNDTSDFEGFYTYELPFSSFTGKRVKNYFKKITT